LLLYPIFCDQYDKTTATAGNEAKIPSRTSIVHMVSVINSRSAPTPYVKGKYGWMYGKMWVESVPGMLLL